MIFLSKPAVLAADGGQLQEALLQIQQGEFNKAVAAREHHLQKQEQQVTGQMKNAEAFENRLVRLPLHKQLSKEEQQLVLKAVYSFFE